MLAQGNSYATGTIVATPGQTVSTHSTKGLIQDTGVQNSYSSYMPGGVNANASSAYAYFTNNGPGLIGIENSFGDGTARSVVDLFKVEPAPAGQAGLPGVLVGAFRLDNNAQLTFDPDPSHFAGPAEVKFQDAVYNVAENGTKVTLTVVRQGTLNTAFTLNFSTADVTA